MSQKSRNRTGAIFLIVCVMLIGFAVCGAYPSFGATSDEAQAPHQNAIATGVVMSESSASMALGETLDLTAMVTPADADQTLTWTSSFNKVLSVSQDGEVVAVGVGTATITATSAGGGFSASCVITVTAPMQDNSLDAAVAFANAPGARNHRASRSSRLPLPSYVSDKDDAEAEETEAPAAPAVSHAAPAAQARPAAPALPVEPAVPSAPAAPAISVPPVVPETPEVIEPVEVVEPVEPVENPDVEVVTPDDPEPTAPADEPAVEPVVEPDPEPVADPEPTTPADEPVVEPEPTAPADEPAAEPAPADEPADDPVVEEPAAPAEEPAAPAEEPAPAIGISKAATKVAENGIVTVNLTATGIADDTAWVMTIVFDNAKEGTKVEGKGLSLELTPELSQKFAEAQVVTVTLQVGDFTSATIYLKGTPPAPEQA